MGLGSKEGPRFTANTKTTHFNIAKLLEFRAGGWEWFFRMGEGSEVTGPQQQRANSLGVYFRPGGGKLLAYCFVTARSGAPTESS
ncbi:hypothetical protein J6590_066031 [Homalodisca vitripennis]|nr:hypothetical protein J6590_066031 [Homalodisca vitripennis]